MPALVVSSASFFFCLSGEGVLLWSAQVPVGDIGPWVSQDSAAVRRRGFFVKNWKCLV